MKSYKIFRMIELIYQNRSLFFETFEEKYSFIDVFNTKINPES